MMIERQSACEFMKKIWIVEDDEAIQIELITLLLNGYLSAAAQPCDFILIDTICRLPGEGGFTRLSETAEACRLRPGAHHEVGANYGR